MVYGRIIVIGNGGSGKSTVARLLAERLQLSHIEIDRLASSNGCNDVPIEVVNQRLSEELTSKQRWAVEGMHRLEAVALGHPKDRGSTVARYP